MFIYDTDYTESDWRHEADARELAELDADRRDMEEYAMETAINSDEPFKAAITARIAEHSPMFADDTGPIGMTPDALPGKRKKAA